jgi:hypothetical protein
MNLHFQFVSILLLVAASFASAAQAQVVVTLTPETADVPTGTTKQFIASVTGTSNTGVKWYVDGVLGGTPDAGTITTSGRYTAPQMTGTHTVSITSNADPAQSDSSTVNITTITVAISPKSVTVNTGQMKQFIASVTGTTNTGVKWYVDDILGGNSTAGTITTSGLYVAPAVPGNHTVTIKSNFDPTKTDSSAVTVVDSGVAVAISPTSANVAAGATQQFAASVSGTTNTGVKWYVDGVLGGNAAAGTISTSGLYTAPTTAGSHVVRTTSNADPTKFADASVNVTAASQVSVNIAPTSANLNTGATQQFTATVSGTSDTSVQWSVDGIAGGDQTVGIIDTSGLYTAPSTAGSHTVRASSNADPTQFAEAAVTVAETSQVSVAISPTSASVTANTTKQFIATVAGTTNTGVKWYVDGILGGNSTAGTITTSGLYTAPATTGNHIVRIISNADPTKMADSAITITAPTAVTVSIIPTSATVKGGETKQFQAVVNGTANTGVKWYVDGVLGGNAEVGLIYSNGLYTAPNLAASRTVSFTSNADPSKSASSAVTITADIYVVVTPQSNCLGWGNSLQFAARVFGTTNQGVTWQVNNITGGSSSAGRITTAGLYTAPQGSGTFTVRAISKANTSRTASVSVTVQSGVTIAISPATYTVPVNGSQQIKLKLCGNNSDFANWAVDGVAGGNSTVGTIDTNGVYRAPAIAGSHLVRATSNANSSKSATAVVTAIDGITVDFGGRDNSTKIIRPNLINSQYTGTVTLANLQAMKAAGFSGVRLLSLLPEIFETRTPNWTRIDPTISLLQSAGLDPILEITYTPPWLVPLVSGCTQNYKMPPNDLTSYAQIAASIVAHMEQNFPGFVKEYEIWNEPDLGSFCVSPNTNDARRAKYINLFAAVAPAMKAEAAKYGVQIKIGGPATVTGAYSNWVPGLTTDSRTAPYLDFVSYHHYITGQAEARNGMTWDSTVEGGPRPLYDRMQDPSGGAAALFKSFANLVAKGTQPNASSTPSYLDEYNDNWWFGPTCCRSDPRYAPVFNALYISDLLNSVFDGSANTPGKIYYYSASAFPYFCLFGQIDAAMDCANVAAQPYPQFYALKLIAADTHLGIKEGGYIAKSILPRAGTAGLAATAFYTPSRNSILITNPTSTAFTQVKVFANNPGFSNANATLFVLNQSYPQIRSEALALTATSQGLSATIDVPPYSVVGIAIKP